MFTRCVSIYLKIFMIGECQWLHADIISSVIKKVSQLFPNVEYGFTTTPTYPSGQIGFIICSLDESIDLKRVHPNKKNGGMSLKDLQQLKYYNEKVHEAAFALPSFTKKLVEEAKRN